MSNFYKGVQVLAVKKEIIDSLYKNKEITIWDKRYKWPQNLYIVLKDEINGQSSVLTKVKKDKLVLLNSKINASNIYPRNKEQIMALDALLDDSINIVVLSGPAGTGKSILTLAAALDKIQNQKYKKLVLTRPMSWVGKVGLGYLPGDVKEKFVPYLLNYMCNLEYMLDGNRQYVQDLIQQTAIEFIPIQLFRGASFFDTYLIVDESQTLDSHEMVTVGTRVGENSKLVILGDLSQRDEKIAREKTGMYKFVNNALAQDSKMVASIELKKCERSPVAALFAEIFGAK